MHYSIMYYHWASMYWFVWFEMKRRRRKKKTSSNTQQQRRKKLFKFHKWNQQTAANQNHSIHWNTNVYTTNNKRKCDETSINVCKCMINNLIVKHILSEAHTSVLDWQKISLKFSVHIACICNNIRTQTRGNWRRKKANTTDISKRKELLFMCFGTGH